MTSGKNLPVQYELVTGGGFLDATAARSTKRTDVQLEANHEEAETRLILHACEAVSRGHKKFIVLCRDTDVVLLLLHFVVPIAAEVWMVLLVRPSGGVAIHCIWPIVN